ncbi:phosphate uptake regulator PhoU [Candidatus Woesearchaeota archaeon]|nr:phosphate uptake regulator PhoU [Candidatus Woesearchaeota archaeon]
MLTRKLVKAGPSSHTIALPKEWIEKNKLKKGDVVYVSDVSDGELRIACTLGDEKAKVDREITIDASGKSPDSVQRLLTSAYLNNYSTVILAGDDLDKRAPDIRRMVGDFVAFEITDQSSKRIVVKDLLNPTEVSVEKTLRRMDMIVRSMFDDLLSKPKKELHFQDKDVNRLYFLMLRALKSALRSEDVAKQLLLTPVHVLTVWQTATQIENLADSLTRLAVLMKSSKSREIEDVLKVVGELFADVMSSYYQGEHEKADLLAKKRLDVEARLTSLQGNSKELGESCQEMRSMATNVCTIAKIVVDKE